VEPSVNAEITLTSESSAVESQAFTVATPSRSQKLVPPQEIAVSPDLHGLHRDLVLQPLPENLLVRKIRTRAESITGKIEDHVLLQDGVESKVVVKRIHNEVLKRMRSNAADDRLARGDCIEDAVAELGTYCRIARLSS